LATSAGAYPSKTIGSGPLARELLIGALPAAVHARDERQEQDRAEDDDEPPTLQRRRVPHGDARDPGLDHQHARHP